MRVFGGLTCMVFGTMLLALAACGGGGDGSGSLETSQPPEPSDPPGPMDGDMPEPSAAELSLVGEYFTRWGVWAGIPREDAVTCTAIGCPPAGDTIFLAYLDHGSDGSVVATVDGIRSGSSPQLGSAVWAGKVLGYAREDGTLATAYAPVSGDARLEADFAAASVAVDFTGFDDGRSDLSWNGLAVEAGVFGDEGGSIEGSFYGAAHEGAAGHFSRDGLSGVFGALRTGGP